MLFRSLKGGTLTLNNNGAISGSNWSVSANGLAHFAKVYGQVANGYQFKGGDITIGGAGSGSSINPGSVAMAGGAGINNRNSLGGGLYRAYKAQFDQLYAKKADIENLNVLSKLSYKGISASWGRVIDGVSSGHVSKNKDGAITHMVLYYTKRWAICAGNGGGGVFFDV